MSLMSVPDAAFVNYALQYKATSKISSEYSCEEEFQLMDYNFTYGFFKEARDWALKILQPTSKHCSSNREIAEKIKNICCYNSTSIMNAKILFKSKKFAEVTAILKPIFDSYPHLSEVSFLYSQAECLGQIQARNLLAKDTFSKPSKPNTTAVSFPFPPPLVMGKNQINFDTSTLGSGE